MHRCVHAFSHVQFFATPCTLAHILFIYFLIWLCWVLFGACRIFTASFGSFLEVQKLSKLWCRLGWPSACGIFVPQPRIKPVSPCIARYILSYLTPRKVPIYYYLFIASFITSELSIKPTSDYRCVSCDLWLVSVNNVWIHLIITMRKFPEESTITTPIFQMIKQRHIEI